MEGRMEELMYGLGCQLEALRLELRAASRRGGGDADDANHYEYKADDIAEEAHRALGHPGSSSETRSH